MSVQKDPSGRRWIQVEVEVHGTPEEVWQAIATGPGVSAWFMPTVIDGRAGGEVTTSFAPGMDSVSKITEWEPPYRFAKTGDFPGANAPPMATEWIVEGRDGGKSVVRVVHSLFTDKDDWDDQLTGLESGWPGFFRILRPYVQFYLGMPCSSVRLMAFAPAPESNVWQTIVDALKMTTPLTVGERWEATGGPEPLSGTLIEAISTEAVPHSITVRLDTPAPGVAVFASLPYAGQIYVGISFYLYGETAAGIVARDDPRWQAWLANLFPPAGMPSTHC